ncbi:MAG: hypothetical protein IJ901_06930 [Bacteroidaceae bacterium]|nr:hypothetical protein [Bacteroidaceae bacterium]
MVEFYKQEINLPGTENQCYYRVRNYDNIGMERLLDYLDSANNGVSRSMAQGTIIALAGAIQRFLCLGHSVTVDGLGTFSISLKVKENKEMETMSDDEKRLNAQSVEVGSINFRPSQSFLADVNKHIKLQRAETNKISRSPYSKEERLQRALDFLTSHPYLTVNDYRQLTGLAHTSATIELRELAADPTSGLACQGRGSHKVYVTKANEQ